MRTALATILAIALPTSVSAATVTLPSMTSQQFNAYVGLNTHIDRTDGMHPNYAFTKAAIQSLRIHRIRTPFNILPGDAGRYTAFLQALDDQDKPDAIRTDEIVGPGLTSSQIVQKMQGLWGVDIFEGPNEPDQNLGNAWALIATAQMQQIAIARNNWPNIKTVMPSVSMADPFLLIGSPADYGNAHIYGDRMPETSGWGGDPYNTGYGYGAWGYNIGMARRAFGTGSKAPVVVTETGCTTDNGLFENTCGIYAPRSVVQCAANATTCFTYEDFDDTQHYGLWDVQGRPKPAAYALQGLMVIASDPDGTKPVACKDTAVLNSSAPITAIEVCHASGEEDIIYSVPAEPQSPTTFANQAVTPVTLNVSIANPGIVRLYKETSEGHYALNGSPDTSNIIATERLGILTIRSAANPVQIPLLPTI